MTQDINILPETDLEKKILNLEKKYFLSLEQIFKSTSFSNRLQKTEKWVQFNYRMLSSWKIANKVRLAAQRIINFEVKDQLTSITDVYASAISSDIAYETDDAIILIDSKTVSETGNANDFKSLQFGPNQCSFENKRFLGTKNFPGIPLIFNLPSIDQPSDKPILTFFLMLKFYDDKESEFKWFDNNRENNIHFSCMPNGKLSRFFKNDLVVGAKTYDYNTKAVEHANGKFSIKKDFRLKSKLPNLQHAVDIKTVKKEGFYIPKSDEIWLTTSKKSGEKYGNVRSFISCRVHYSDLMKRYDANRDEWLGVSSWKIDTKVLHARHSPKNKLLKMLNLIKIMFLKSGIKKKLL